MEENNTNQLKILEDIMIDEIKPVLIEFKKFEKENKDLILSKQVETQEKIDGIMNNPLGIRLDYEEENEQDGELEDNEISDEAQQIIKDALINEMLAKQEKRKEKIEEMIAEKKAKASDNCKYIINSMRSKMLEDKKELNGQLREVRGKLKPINNDLKDIKATIKGAKPTGISFKILDEQQKELMSQKMELAKQESELINQKSELEYNIQEFDEKYLKIDFLSESAIDDLFVMIYGESVSSDLILQEEEFFKEVDRAAQSKQVEGEEKPEQIEEEETNKSEGEKSSKKPEKVSKESEGQVAKQTQKSTTSKAQEQNNNSAPKQVQNNTTAQKSKQEEPPKMIYSAKKDRYIIKTPKSDKILGLRRKSIEDVDGEIENISKEDLANELELKEEELNNVDLNVVKMWKIYDNIYGTNEAVKYISSILNQSQSQSAQVEYDLTGMYTNRNLPGIYKKQLLDYANFAKENKIADVRKGRIENIMEGIDKTFRFTKGIKEKIGKMGNSIGNLFKRIKNGQIKQIASEKLNEDIKSSKIKEDVTTPRNRKENMFKKETTVTTRYNTISQEIAGASQEELNKIVERAKEEVRNGNMSKTEFGGLMYTIGSRQYALSNQKGQGEKQPVGTRPEQGESER